LTKLKRTKNKEQKSNKFQKSKNKNQIKYKSKKNKISKLIAAQISTPCKGGVDFCEG
jgi:hypothetical protein